MVDFIGMPGYLIGDVGIQYVRDDIIFYVIVVHVSFL